MKCHGQLIVAVAFAVAVSLLGIASLRPASFGIDGAAVARASNEVRTDAASQQPVITPPPGPQARVCPGLDRWVPSIVILHVLANSGPTRGFGKLCNPNHPPSIWNGRRTWLSLHDPSKPFHPLFNGLEWKCGCG